MDTHSLEVFLDVAKQLSFAKVAEARAVNASTISRVIATLEDELGVKLFTRTTRTMVLTEAGHTFAIRMTQHVEDLRQTFDEVKSLKNEVTGTLNLSASVAFGERVLVPILGEFRQLYPQLNLNLRFNDQNLDLLQESIDVAIRLAPAIEKNMVVSKLFNTQYLLCASPGFISNHSLTAKPELSHDLPGLQYTLPQFQQGWHFQHKQNTDESGHLMLHSNIQVSSVLSIRSLCLQGMGIALLADWLIKEDLQQGRLVALYPDYRFTATSFDTSAWIIYPDRHYVPKKVRVFIDFLKSKLQ